jgi:hypothetical protein
MSAPAQMNGNGQAPPPIVPEDPMQGVNEMLGAIRLCAQKARGVGSAAEAKDFAAAALSFAQAIIVLDPSLSQGGTPLAHDLALEEVRGETQQAVAQIQGEHAVRLEQVRGQNALRQAKETAAAPTPAKHITINRESGRTSATVKEG